MSSYRGTTLTITLSFLAGVLLTLGFKDVYPDLQARFLRKLRRASISSLLTRSSQRRSNRVHLDDDQTDARIVEPNIPVGIEGCIGNTPLFKIRSLSEATGCEILGKAEFLNGAGNSPKDRVALNMIQTAEDQGLLTPHVNGTVYEGTVGSTGISLAAICRARGYKAHICMPDDVATEKSDLLLKLGAEVERVRPSPIVSTRHFVNLARQRALEHTNDSNVPGNGLFANQFENDANYLAHYQSTGPEIYNQTGGRLDAFVSGAGTGGTISGISLYLKPKMTNLKVVLADPQGSGLYNRIKYGVMFASTEKEGTRRRHQVDTIVEGVGINRVTSNFEAGRELIDDAIKVSDEQAMMMARWLVEKDGIFIGSSSAVNCVAAVILARQLGPGKRIVTLLCDSGTRHLSKFWAEAAKSTSALGSLDDVLYPKPNAIGVSDGRDEVSVDS